MELCNLYLRLSPPPRPSFLSPPFSFLSSLNPLLNPPLSLLSLRTRPLKTRIYAEEKDEGEEFEESEEEEEYEEDEVEEEESSSPKKMSVLSLNQKPNRSLAMLDDYEIEEVDPNHKSGYVAVFGKPNVGKSTLSNQMIGQKLSIVTDKPQTTRHRILGICSGDNHQIILYDTPGVIEKEMHKLDSMMMKNVRSAVINADCILVVVDACKVPQSTDYLLEGLKNVRNKPPALLVVNKRDKIKPGEIKKRVEWYEKNMDVDDVIPVSAKYGHGVDDVRQWILTKIPFGPAYYPKDIVSEHPERFFIGEIVREKIFLQYRNELPYCCQVNVKTYKARPGKKDFIQVEVLVEKDTQKKIIVGREGKALKVFATAARLDIEDFLQKKVYLEVDVKVREKWREDEALLKTYGYGGPIRV
ncbi:hypothetical protein LUZ60_008227 [Juncus effusus]|nr:hypothetical protein LUZ60_008227 [Juncus effusus]